MTVTDFSEKSSDAQKSIFGSVWCACPLSSAFC